MKNRVVLIPLEEEYEILVERVTNLEKFYNCPYSYKFGGGYKPSSVEKQLESEQQLMLGNIVHEVVQHSGVNKDKLSNMMDLITKQVNGIYDEKKSKHVLKMIDSAVETFQKLVTKGVYEVVATEMKLYVEVEIGKILLIITGSADAISCVDGKYTFIDWKTSKEEYTEDDVNAKIQKYLYPWMAMHTVGEENVDGFDYLVITKHAKPRSQRIPIRFNSSSTKKTTEYDRLYRGENLDIDIQLDKEEIKGFVSKLLFEYVDAYLSQFRVTKNKNGESDAKQCIWCCLRNICPAFSKTAHKLDSVF